MPGGVIDRRHYELCVLAELRDRLRAGDVWVAGSRQYRSVEERLISKQTFQDLQSAGAIPVAVEADFEKFIESRRALLDKRLTDVNSRAKDGLLASVTIEKGVLKVTPIEKSIPPEAEALAARLYAMLPRIRVTDLLAEVCSLDTVSRLLHPSARPFDLRLHLLAQILAEPSRLSLRSLNCLPQARQRNRR